MTRFLYILLIFLSFLACKNDDGNEVNEQNPFLIEPLVNLNLNLNLPEYNQLLFPNNSVVINSQGIRGIVVYNVNNDLYTAFDLTDPNHTANGCSQMEINGIVVTCGCEDGNSHDIVTGQHQSNPEAFPMLQYRVQRNGNTISISN